MGIYVQQQHFQEVIELSGIWSAPHKITIDILINERLCTIHFPGCVFPQTTSSIITAKLPSYLSPIKDNFDTTNATGGIIRAENNGFIFGSYRIGMIAPDGDLIIRIGAGANETIPFSGTGNGGFYRFDVSYILNQTR